MKRTIVFQDIEKLKKVIAASRTLADVTRAFQLEPSGKRNRIIRRLAVQHNLDIRHLIGNRSLSGYGRFTREQLTDAARTSTSISAMMRSLGMNPRVGSSGNALRKRLQVLGIDTSHFSGSGWAKGLNSNKRKSADEVLCRLPPCSRKVETHVLRRAMLESGFKEECVLCGLGRVWRGRPLVIQIDHIDGDTLNNLKSNLRFVCPNCHSQTDTYGNKNGRTSQLA